MAVSISPLTRGATTGLLRLMQGEPLMARLNVAWRHRAKWRSELLANTLVAKEGRSVLAGPFKGMSYGVRAARLLGRYEASLIQRAAVISDIEGAEAEPLDPAKAPGLDRAMRPDLLPGWTETLSDLFRLVLLWEWRASPTPWLWMECR